MNYMKMSAEELIGLLKVRDVQINLCHKILDGEDNGEHDLINQQLLYYEMERERMTGILKHNYKIDYDAVPIGGQRLN